MSFDVDEIGAEHLTVNAADDLRGLQFYAVKVFPQGVLRATADVTSGPGYVLMNSPNSGEACTLYGPPNCAKAIAGGTVAIGQQITANGSGYWIQGSVTNMFGQARTAVASGGVFALRLI